MHWYKRNIGDYHKKAGRLSMLQHGAYTLLIDACYDREQFPTIDQAIDWCWASTKEEIEAVEFVLRKFFVPEDGVYVQKRMREEVEVYRENADKNKRIALEREAKRRQNSTKRAQVVNESPPNQEPGTSNQEPVKDNISVENPKPKTKRDFPHWKLFFDAYPENKKGGTDTSAWDAAKRNGLDDNDFQLMLDDVQRRTKETPTWYTTFALGICKYISERYWLTPITPDQPPTAPAPTQRRPMSEVLREQQQ